jgi:photosystem I P700 chlorophyll a apoprotein A1
MYFHGARFSNYEAWLTDPTHIKPSAQIVYAVVGQEILNGDVGGGFQGIQITSGFFQLWRGSGITSELQLYTSHWWFNFSWCDVLCVGSTTTSSSY